MITKFVISQEVNSAESITPYSPHILEAAGMVGLNFAQNLKKLYRNQATKLIFITVPTFSD